MKKLSKLFISFLVVSCFLFGCGTNAASVDKQKAEEALALYQSYRDGEGDCQEIMAKITSVSRDIEDDELAELVSGIATLMPFENENGTESTDEQIAKIKEHIGISDTVENSNSETDDSPSWDIFGFFSKHQMMVQAMKRLSMKIAPHGSIIQMQAILNF